MKSDLEYFKKGFVLANKNLALLLVTVVFFLANALVSYMGNTGGLGLPYLIILPASVIIFFLMISYSFVRFKFLENSTQGLSFNYEVFKNELWKQFKRLILPLILFMVIATMLSGVFFAFITKNYSVNFLDFKLVSSIWGLCLGLIISLFWFFPIFFVIEGEGVKKAILNALRFAVKHLSFMVFLFVVGFLSWFLNLFGEMVLGKMWAELLVRSVLLPYILFAADSAALLYFLDERQR